ncbi:outer membrane beta-barrel protein [Flavivirga aquatica]
MSKNKLTLGGSLNFDHNNTENEYSNSKNHLWGINPDIGYAVNKNFILGIGAGFDFFKNKNEYSSSNNVNYETKSHRFSVFPYLRKYFSISEKLAFNLEGGLTFSIRWNENARIENSIIDMDKSTTISFSVGITPGITYQLFNKVYLYSNLGNIGYFKNENEREDEISKSDSFNFNAFTKNLNFGLFVTL